MNWINSEVKFLGIYIGNDREMASLRTFNEILEKIKQKISYWNTKSISIKGKIKILNTFVLSKLWYALECQDIPNEIHVDLKNLISTFIWKGYHQRNYNTLCTPYSEGGLGLQSIEIKRDIFRIKWITNLLSHKNLQIEKNVVDSFFENNTGQIGLRILLNNSTVVNKIKNNFYKKTYKT